MRGTLLSFAAAAAALCVVVFACPLVPTSDGPQHLLAAWVVAHIDDYSAWVEPVFARTGAMFTEVLIALLALLPWRAAYAAALALTAVLWLTSTAALGAALGKPKQGVVVGAATALSWPFYMGLFSFQMGTALGLCAVALVVARRHETARGRVGLAALLLLAAHAHVLAGALAGLVVVVVAAAAADRARALRAMAWVALCGVPAGALALVAARAPAAALPTIYDEPLDRVAVLAWGYLGGPVWRALPPVALAVVGAVQGLRAGGARRALAGAGVVFAVAAVVLPRDGLGGWQFLSPRPVLMALTMLLLLVDVPHATAAAKARIAAVLAVVAGALVVVAPLAWSLALHARFAEEAAVLLRHLDDRVEKPGVRVPAVQAPGDPAMESGLAFFNPFWNLGQLFVVTQGGYAPFTFASPVNGFSGVYMLRQKETVPPEIDRVALIGRLRVYEPEDRAAAFADLVDNARRYDGVIAFEPERDHAGWERRGFVPDVVDGRLFLGRYRGCRVGLVAPAGAVVVESGLVPRSAGGEVERDFVLPAVKLACGPLWLRFRDAHGDVVKCGARDEVELDAKPEGSVVTCEQQR